MAVRLAARDAEEPRDVVHRVCEELSRGGLVALPTETRYVLAASARQPQSVERLRAIDAARGPALFVKSIDEVGDYIASIPLKADRIARRIWPGPVVLSLDGRLLGGLTAALPDAARNWLTTHERATFRASAHPIVSHVLKLSPDPLIVLDGDDGPLTAQAADDSWGSIVNLVVDAGPSRFEEPATVVAFDGDDWRVVSPGVVAAGSLARLASAVVLFVCTGNTCRSPMAEWLFRHELAQALACTDEQLVERGFLVMSAGLAAARGAPASREAVELLHDDGVDMSSHESVPLTDRLLQHADFVFTMTGGHRHAILHERPETSSRVRLLRSDGHDVADPIGGGMEEYRLCRDEILQEVRRLVRQFVAP